MIIILNDNEITAANDFLKNDVFENLTNAQNILVALSPKDQEAVKNHHRNVVGKSKYDTSSPVFICGRHWTL